ncbi:ABC transporter ATP-binding protein [Paenibacillus sp. YN15]|uniref:ABC transporter ATP-binding protein n=1 Tax=Paenibacillus sp. YN15 TaxID=1742774 RepID=UPI000DCEBBE9|nr:ABC transporter ATP-binding protein [Paenibacillus sp. YN15]RAV03558.1 ABC transporter ATP-binding protein [Paenibacillus sp. YN15]
MQPFVELADLTVRLGGQTIFHRLRLELKKGVSYALIGKSGVGKSTLLNVIAGFIQPSEGSVMVDGAEVLRPRRGTAFLMQELGLFPWQTVYEAVHMPLRLSGKQDTGEVQRNKVMQLLREMELDTHCDKYPHELSGGQRQRAALARTLVDDPDFLLMDEPTSSLDSVTKHAMQDLMLAQLQRRQTTLLMVTHDIEEAVMMGEHILLLREQGKIESRSNPFYGCANPREQLGFYETCISIRQWMNAERSEYAAAD